MIYSSDTPLTQMMMEAITVYLGVFKTQQQNRNVNISGVFILSEHNIFTLSFN